MRIRAGYEISYDCPQPTSLLLMLTVRPERVADLLTPHEILVEPDVPIHDYTDSFGNTCSRLVAPAGRITVAADFVVADDGLPDEVAPDAVQASVDELPDEVLIFLLASRYCETEHLTNMAWSLFGGIAPGWARVQAIVDYVHDRVVFGYQHARPTKTAYDVHEERAGVCRDFAHLAITLCRCMNIPARYCTGYLGDIGVPPSPADMDFSAWFEVYLSGRWYTFDARHNQPRIGRIPMARGRDATDTAITTSFGPHALSGFKVITEEVTACGFPKPPTRH
jgi:transglutaminase-like putative cysteine protease